MWMLTNAHQPWNLDKSNIKRKDKNTPNFSPTSVPMSQQLLDAKVEEPQSLPRKTKPSLKSLQEEPLITATAITKEVVKATSQLTRKPITLVGRLHLSTHALIWSLMTLITLTNHH